MAGLGPYPGYRDSGVPWLGEIPEHWRERRLKSSMNNIVESTGPRSPGQLRLALENVESWTGRIRAGTTDPEAGFDSQTKRFQAGDVLFGKLRPYLAKVTRPDRDGACVGDFLVLRSTQADVRPEYMERLLRSKRIIDVVNSATFGAKMPRADWTFIGGLRIALPPPEEQVLIARYLDQADRRIQHAITEKEKQIALLEEQKTGHHPPSGHGPDRRPHG